MVGRAIVAQKVGAIGSVDKEHIAHVKHGMCGEHGDAFVVMVGRGKVVKW